MTDTPIFDTVVEVADAAVRRLDPLRVKWQWDEASLRATGDGLWPATSNREAVSNAY